MGIWVAIVIFVLICFSFSFPAFSEIYKLRDQKGNVSFSDSRPSGGEVEKIKTREDQENPKAKKEERDKATAEDRIKKSGKKIKVPVNDEEKGSSQGSKPDPVKSGDAARGLR